MFSKLLERSIKIQLVKHLTTNDILSQTQSGFRQEYSCNTALLHLTDHILRATDNGQLTDS